MNKNIKILDAYSLSKDDEHYRAGSFSINYEPIDGCTNGSIPEGCIINIDENLFKVKASWRIGRSISDVPKKTEINYDESNNYSLIELYRGREDLGSSDLKNYGSFKFESAPYSGE